MASPLLLLFVALALSAAAPSLAINCPSQGGNQYCPIISSNWDSGGKSSGFIFNDGSSLLSVLDTVYSDTDCQTQCTNNAQCAYWSYAQFGLFARGCFLHKCGACTSGIAYSDSAHVGSLDLGNLFGLIGILGLGLSQCSSGAVAKNQQSCKGVKGDPHFGGADGSHYDFTGVPNTTYALLTDVHIHVNMFLGGRFDQWDDVPNKPLTWIRQVGILWGHHTIALRAREGASWQYDSGYMGSIEVDGQPITLATEGDRAVLAGGKIEISWAAARVPSGDDEIDVYVVKIANVMLLRLKVRPEVAPLRTSTDGIVHFSVELPQVILSESAHGVLGQTYRADHRSRLGQQRLVHSELLGVDVVPAENGAGFLDGAPEDYQVSALLAADCQVSRFARATGLDSETAKAIEITSGAAHSSYSTSSSAKLQRGFSAARKMLL